MGALLFAIGPGEQFNTDKVVICSLLVIDNQDITVKEVTDMKVTFTNNATGEKMELEAGPVGVFGMDHGERMELLDQLVRELFNERKKIPK